MSRLSVRFGAILVCLVFAGCEQYPRGQVSPNRLVALIRNVEPWRASKDYSPAAWQYATEVARTIQRSDSTVVEIALSDFSEKYSELSTSDYVEMSKVFLLMRLVFEIPDHLPGDHGLEMLCWTRITTITNDDGTINGSWPVSWRDGNPFLVQRFAGTLCSSYPARSEYKTLLKTFKYRDLSISLK